MIDSNWPSAGIVSASSVLPGMSTASPSTQVPVEAVLAVAALVLDPNVPVRPVRFQNTALDDRGHRPLARSEMLSAPVLAFSQPWMTLDFEAAADVATDPNAAPPESSRTAPVTSATMRIRLLRLSPLPRRVSKPVMYLSLSAPIYT